MQDIRKPYTRSRSSEDLQSRLERFHDGKHRATYGYDSEEEPVRIPVRGGRKMDDMAPRRSSHYYEEEGETTDEYRPEKNIPRDMRSTPYKGGGRRRPPLSSFLYAFIVMLVVASLLLYTYVFDSATITIVPKYKDIKDFSQIISFAKEGETTNDTTVPFIIETAKVSKSKALTRSESKRVETKASGKVIIYNNFDDKPQKLIKNTRFQSKEGLIYRINDSITIPGKKGETPGSVEIALYADSTGSEYNIASTEFTIPGFKGSPRYTGFYAKTKTPMSGGSSGNKSLVSLSDINAAKDSLALELEKEVQYELKKIVKEGYIPMVNASQIVYEDNEKELLSGEGEVYKVTATGYLMLADASKLATAVAKTTREYDNANVRLTYLDTLDFIRKETTPLVNATSLPILIEGNPRVVWVVDKEDLKSTFLGKNTDDFKIVMKSVSSVESAEMHFSPIWLSHFPNTLEKINVEESSPKR